MPMKTVFCLIALLALHCLGAADDAMLRRTGGLVFPKDNGKRIAIVNSCGASTNAIGMLVKGSEKLLHIPVKIFEAQPSGKSPYKSAKSYKGADTPVVIYIYSGEKDGPILSVFVEDAIAAVNTAPLKSTSAEIESDRLCKELYRAYGLILGAYYSAKLPSVLSPAYSVGQIDNIPVKMYSPMHITAILHTAKILNLPILRPATYESACRMGWAPAPTNDVQKAIWDKVHAVPATPMKIEFDPKKGR